MSEKTKADTGGEAMSPEAMAVRVVYACQTLAYPHATVERLLTDWAAALVAEKRKREAQQ